MLVHTDKRCKSLVILHMLTNADSSTEWILRAGLYPVCRDLDGAYAALTSHTGEIAVPECRLYLWGPVTRMEVSGENRGGDVGNAFRICSCNSNGLFRSLLTQKLFRVCNRNAISHSCCDNQRECEGGEYLCNIRSWMLYKNVLQ